MKFTAKHVMLILMSVLLVLVVVMGLIVLDRVSDFLQLGSAPGVNTPMTSIPSSSSTSAPATVGSSVATTPENTDPSHEHNFVKGKTFKANCVSSGYTLYECECGKEDIRDFTNPLGHVYGEATVIEATCTSDGWTERTCSRCNNVERSNLVAAFHVGEWTDVPSEDGPSTHEQRICELCNALEVRRFDAKKDWVFCLTPVGEIGDYIHYKFRVDIANTDNDFTGNIYTNIADADFGFDYEDKNLFVSYSVNGERKQYTIIKGTTHSVFHDTGRVTHEEPVAETDPDPEPNPDSDVDQENSFDSSNEQP